MQEDAESPPPPQGSRLLTVHHHGASWIIDPAAEVWIGRDARCQIVVDDPLVSRRHACLGYLDGWTVRDMSSTNGTWLDGRRLMTPQSISGSLRVRLGGIAGAELLLTAASASAVVGTGDALVTVGRGRDNDIVLKDLLVSRRHLRLARTQAGLELVDLDSRNRTFVNGDPVARATLTEGDRVTIGNTDLQVVGGRITPVGSSGRLRADAAGYTLAKGKTLLAGVDLDVGPGTFAAIIGPSGAGKSTLMNVLTGALPASDGTVTYDSHSVYTEREVLRNRIAFVPQDDIVHRGLTVHQALTYAARLRLPEDTAPDEIAARVAEVIDELGLAEQAHLRIAKVSGGQRKRASVAMELLTKPSLLILDEPTSGLDPALDHQVMTTLRKLADAGRIVIVVTHSVLNLGLCDQVVMIAAGGVPAFAGPPGDVLQHLRANNWTEAYAIAAAWRRPAPAAERRSRQGVAERAARPVPMTLRSRRGQLTTLVGRHVRLIGSDPAYAAFLALLPAILAILSLTVPGRSGFGAPAPGAHSEASQLLVLLIVGAGFTGAAASAREVVGERAILRREVAAGLDIGAYVLSKIAVFTAVIAAQAALLVGGLLLVKPGPHDGALLGSGALELYLAVAVTALSSCALGLAASSVVRSGEQVMPLLVVIVMAQLVLCGGLIPVTGRPALAAASWLVPGRWGYSAGAATVDLRTLDPSVPSDAMWTHSAGPWLVGIGAPLVIAVAVLGLTAGTLRRSLAGTPRA